MKKDVIATALIVGIVSFFMNACSSPDKYKAEIAQLDSLITKADSALHQLNSIDSLKLQSDIDSLNSVLKLISENNTDTLGREIALSLVNCSRVLSSFKIIQEEYPLLKKELIKAEKQVDDLKGDLRINAIGEQSVQLFVNSESEAVQQLLNSSELLLKVYAENIALLENNFDAVMALVDSMRIR